jgi:hypothetical protein
MTTVLLPHPKDVRDMFTGLLGRDVEVAPGTPVVPTDTVRAAIGVYVEDNLSLAAAAAADLPLAAYAGAALGLIPKGAADDAVEEKSLPTSVWENFAELLNIGASLLNHDNAPHVRLYGLHNPDELPTPDVAALLRGLGHRLDLVVKISGYGTGALSIVRKP